MNPVPSQNHPNTDLLITVVRYASTSACLEDSAAEHFGEEAVEAIFQAASTVLPVSEERKESDSLEALENPTGRTVKELIYLLLADSNVNLYAKDATGWPLLFFAVENITVLKLLFEKRPELAEYFSSITVTDTNESPPITWNAILWAASGGQIESVMFLLSKLPEPELKAEQAKIIRTFLTTKNLTESRQSTFLTLLKAFALPADEINAFLLEAIHTYAAQAITVLLAAPNIEVNATNFFGWTALIEAVSQNYAEAITALLAVPGIEVNVMDNIGWTALRMAARDGNAEALTALLTDSNLDINAADANGRTALVWAARNSHVEAVSALLTAPGMDLTLHNQAARAIAETQIEVIAEMESNQCRRLIQTALDAREARIPQPAAQGVTSLRFSQPVVNTAPETPSNEARASLSPRRKPNP